MTYGFLAWAVGLRGRKSAFPPTILTATTTGTTSIPIPAGASAMMVELICPGNRASENEDNFVEGGDGGQYARFNSISLAGITSLQLVATVGSNMDLSSTLVVRKNGSTVVAGAAAGSRNYGGPAADLLHNGGEGAGGTSGGIAAGGGAGPGGPGGNASGATGGLGGAGNPGGGATPGKGGDGSASRFGANYGGGTAYWLSYQTNDATGAGWCKITWF